MLRPQAQLHRDVIQRFSPCLGVPPRESAQIHIPQSDATISDGPIQHNLSKTAAVNSFHPPAPRHRDATPNKPWQNGRLAIEHLLHASADIPHNCCLAHRRRRETTRAMSPQPGNTRPRLLPRVATFPGRHKIPSSDLRVRYVPTNYHSYVGIYLGDVLRTLLRDPAHCGGYPIYGQCEKYCAGVDILEGPITRDLARQTIPWPCPLTTNNGTAEVKSRCPPQLPCSRTSVRMPLRCAVLRDLASERPKSALSSAAQ